MADVNESALRTYIRTCLLEASSFDEWLSPDVVRLLIFEYAKRNPKLGTLAWEYGQLPSTTWGRFDPAIKKLIVNKSKTHDMFKQQVSTILHEIQHWNQLVDFVNANPGLDVERRRSYDKLWMDDYERQRRRVGYERISYEVDARRFQNENLEAAIQKISSKLYSSKQVDGELSDVIEELVDEYTESNEPLHRRVISKALIDYGFIGPDYMNSVIQQLRSLDVEITG